MFRLPTWQIASRPLVSSAKTLASKVELTVDAQGREKPFFRMRTRRLPGFLVWVFLAVKEFSLFPLGQD
jgi:hypothetical protein